jgi:hypothetical protein
MHNVISPKILRARHIQRRYTHAGPGASLWADGAHANYGIYVGTMMSYQHVSLFPLLSIILGFEKIPYYSKRNSSIMCVSLWLTIKYKI